MSFIIQNKDLYNALFKIAQEQPLQAHPFYASVVWKGLLDNLEKNVNNYSEDNFTSQRDNSELYLKNLQSAYQFLLFLQQNGVLYENEPLCVMHSPKFQANDPKQHISQYAQRGLDVSKYYQYPNSRGNDFRFWVNKEGVTKFIKSLYDKSQNTEQGGEVLKVLLDKLLAEINQNSGQNKIDPNAKTKPKIDPNTLVDGFPQMYDIKNPKTRGDKGLSVKDLDSIQTLQRFFLSNVKVLNGKEELDVANDICPLLNALHLRANEYTIRNTDQRYNELFEYYKGQIEEFANSSNCSLSNKPGTGTDKEKGSGTDGEDKEKGSGKDKSGRNRQTGYTDSGIKEVMYKLPLNMQNIDFDRIGKFFEELMKQSSEQDKGIYQKYNMQIESLKNRYQDVLKDSSPSAHQFSLQSSPLSVMNMLKEGSNYKGFLELLKLVVSTTRDAVIMLQRRLSPLFEESNSFSQYEAWLNAQVGYEGTNGNSIAYQNLSVLSRLESNVGQVFSITKGNKR